jgi:hypothetical protein
MSLRRITFVAVLVISLLAGAMPAEASRKATRTEAKAIKKAFLKGRKGKTRIRKIRVSTANTHFAAVSYSINIPEVKAAKAYKPPSPVILKEGKGGKWKTVPKAPAKVKKDLKEKPRSNIRISGDVNTTLTRPASCTSSKGFYSASVYDRASDTYLSIQINRFTGFGNYPALGVRSLAALSVGNMGTTPQWETGQGNNAEAPSGAIYVDAGRWGIIEAGMAKIPDATTYPITVSVSGTFDCR